MLKTGIRLLAATALATTMAFAHQGGHPPAVVHAAGNAMPPLPSAVKMTLSDGVRTITASSLPDHWHGRFPNVGNPNPIVPQNKTFRMPAVPTKADNPQSRGPIAFGVALNGVPFEPSAAEFWRSDRQSGWQYEALTGALNLGLDENHAHVQPNGKYHYHGIPTGLLKDGGKTPVVQLLGYAADGYPIYGPWGHADPMDATSKLRQLRPGYRVKRGTRPTGAQGPGGAYDGTFVQDYEFVAGNGDLDAFNGRFGVTPEYPKGTWHYVVTETWPYVSRWFRGVPDDSFRFGPGATSARPAGPRPPGPGGPGGPPRASDALTLATNHRALRELDLSPGQNRELRALAAAARPATRPDPRGQEPQEFRDRLRQQRQVATAKLNAWMEANLSASQKARWQQLLRQQQGMDFFISEEARELFGYGDAQFAEIYETIVTARTGTDPTPMPEKRGMFGRPDKHPLWEAIMDRLTPAQRQQLDATLGKRVELSRGQVRRFYRHRRPE